MKFPTHYLILVALSVTLPAVPLRAADAAAASSSAVSFTDEQKMLLKAIDDALVRFDALLATDTNAEHRAMIGGFLNGFHEHPPAVKEDDALLALLTGVNWPNGFKQRAAAMHQVAFDQGKYDELKLDIDVQYQRLVVFLAPVRTPSRAKVPKAAGVMLERISPSPADRSDVTAALAALDQQVKLREESVRARPAGPEREADTARLSAIKHQRTELARNFTQAGWKSVVSELNSFK